MTFLYKARISMKQISVRHAKYDRSSSHFATRLLSYSHQQNTGQINDGL